MVTLHTLAEGIRIALDALRANKLRSALTILGVTIGVGVVVTMAALITGIRSSVLEAFEAAGPDNFIVMPFDFSEVRIVSDGSGRPPWWNRPDLTDAEIQRIRSLPGVGTAVVDFDFSLTLSFQGTRVEGIQASGNSSGWPAYTTGDFVAGRDFIPAEVGQARPVIVLSESLADALFDRRDPIGQRVRASAGNRGVNETFTVVGVFSIEGNVFAEAVDNFAVVPYTSADKRLKARNRFNFVSLAVVPDGSVSRAELQDRIIGTLRSMRGLGPAEDNDFALVRSEQLVEQFNQLTSVFFLVMLALSSVGLMVGGVGVIGIMLIAVTERTREIGIRKAVGATSREILWQYLVEAAVLTALGGAGGMILGWIASSGVARATPIPASIPLWSIFAALGSAVVTGLIFGLLPAYRASRLQPVDALRFE